MGFDDDVGMTTCSDAVARHMLALSAAFAVPPSRVFKTDAMQDRAGQDYIIITGGAPSGIVSTHGAPLLSVDFKYRRPGALAWMHDGLELAVERWSVKEAAIPGLAYKDAVPCDYVVYEFADLPRVVYVVSATALWQAAHDGRFSNYRLYEQATADFGGYHSACAFVPLLDVSTITGLCWTVTY